jgi:hypothetical protein
MVEASYLALFAFRDQNAAGIPIFGHCYDFPIPNGVHPACAGPWPAQQMAASQRHPLSERNVDETLKPHGSGPLMAVRLGKLRQQAGVPTAAKPVARARKWQTAENGALPFYRD